MIGAFIKPTKNSQLFLAVLFFLTAQPVHAVLIYSGTISGVVIAANGWPGGVSPGMPVSGSFAYDYDLLSPPDSSGLREISPFDSCAFVSISCDGLGGTAANATGMWLQIAADGLPYSGFGSPPDIAIGPNWVFYLPLYPEGYKASVTYQITSVPDAGATSYLFGIGLAAVAGARRFIKH